MGPGRTFQVVRGNLLDEPVDAIVNAANGALAHGGGVAGIISRAAGPELQEESDAVVRTHGFFATGSAVATGAGKSFPAVSAGIFAVPLETCARAYLKAGRASPLRQARLCLRDQPIIDAVLKEMGR